MLFIFIILQQTLGDEIVQHRLAPDSSATCCYPHTLETNFTYHMEMKSNHLIDANVYITSGFQTILEILSYFAYDNLKNTHGFLLYCTTDDISFIAMHLTLLSILIHILMQDRHVPIPNHFHFLQHPDSVWKLASTMFPLHISCVTTLMSITCKSTFHP